MNWDLIALVVFYGLLLLIFLIYRKKFVVQSKIFVLYRTKIGLKLMDRAAKCCPKFMRFLGYIGVVVGFGGMAFIFYFLVKETFKFVIRVSPNPPLAPVLPGVPIAGAPQLHLGFWHWIIAIFLVALVHEFSHGLFARVHKIKVTNSGFAFLGPILAAFVEPDEKQLKKAGLKKQLTVYAAGPYANFIFAVLFLLLLNLVSGPLFFNLLEPNGVVVSAFVPGYPMEKLNISLPFTINEVNGMKTPSLEKFSHAMSKIKAGDEVTIKAGNDTLHVTAAENPANKSKGFIGVTGFSENYKVKDKYSYIKTFVGAFLWMNKLLLWLFIINLGVGLFNLLPIGPVDGGRMFYATLLHYFSKTKAKRIFSIVSLFILLLIFINILPYLGKLVAYLAKGASFILSLI